MLNVPDGNLRKSFHRNYLWISGIVSGIVFYQEQPVFYPVLIFLLLIAGLLSYFRNWRSLNVLLLALMLGLAAAWINDLRSPPVVLKGFIYQQKFEITDCGALGRSQYNDEQLPYRVEAAGVINGKNVKVQLVFPQDLENPGLAEGEIWSVTGNFYQVEAAAEFFMADGDGSWRDVSNDIARTSYQKYLELRGISGELIVKSLQRERESDSWLHRFKRSCASRLDQGIKSADHRAMLSAVTLGLRSRLPSYIKRQFAEVGTAHLFSVSGLHVGILAFLLLLALRPLPAVWHWLICSTLVFYVFVTGGSAPAVRAFAMVWIVEFFKSRCLYIPSTELLMLIAGGVLLMEPDYLTDGGFQYSFIITFFLLVSAETARGISRSASGAAYWWGERSRTKKFLLKLRGTFCSGLFYAGVAAIASAGLMLLHQDLFFAGSMAVNLLILPVMTPLFAAALLKCLLPWGDVLWNFLLENMLSYLEWIVKFAGEFSERSSWMHPHWLTVTLFLILLMLVIINLQKKIAILLTAGVFAVTAWQLLLPVRNASQAAVVISGGEIEQPLAAIMFPESGSMYLLNCNREAVLLLDQTSYYYGVNHIERFDAGTLTVNSVNGLPRLLKRFEVAKFRRIPGKVRSKRFAEFTGGLYFTVGAESGKLSIDGKKNVLAIKNMENGSWQVNYGNRNYELKRTFKPRVYIIEQLLR